MPRTKAGDTANDVLDVVFGDESNTTIDSPSGATVNDLLIALYKEANAPFDKTYQRPIAGGRQLTYITTEQSMSRLQEVYGPQWTWSLCQPVITPTAVLVVGSLTVRVGDTFVTRDGAGGANIALKADGNPMDVGNNFKAAESSAFKRAAAKFGVGAYLYEKDDSVPQYNTPAFQNQVQYPQYTPPPSQGQPVQFGQNALNSDTTTGPIEAISVPGGLSASGKPKLGGLKVNGSWYNVSSRNVFDPTQFQKGQIVTIKHPAGQSFIDAVNVGGSAPEPQEAF